VKRFDRPDEMRGWSRKQRAAGTSIALVPTMGALHEGHLSLVRLAAERADRVVVSIFVNPAQFSPSEDLGSYPRDVDGDLALLEDLGVAAAFTPAEDRIYPAGFSTWVVETALSASLEGVVRPGHFRGVATVVTKLLTIVEPDLLLLGQKDAQQVAVLRRVLADLDFPVEIIVGPTVRESDGLALSSRNAYLSNDERRQAARLYEALQLAGNLIRGGGKDPEAVLQAMRTHIEQQSSARIDYIAAVDPESLQPVDQFSGNTLVCLAVFIGSTRLIDNELIDPEV
jgi:pantoate--beta-alanine ligase